MQKQPPENQDFAAVHFNKESLVAAQGRAIQSTGVLLSNNAFVYTLPGPPPTNRATGAAVSELKGCNLKDLIPTLAKEHLVECFMALHAPLLTVCKV